MRFNSIYTGDLFRRLSLVLLLGLASPSGAILLDRGGGLIYDTQRTITWTQDASLCVTLNNCVNGNDETGGMTWDDAKTWAANLVYGGFDDWRLATIHELSHMYYINLGGCFIGLPCENDPDNTGNQTVGGVTLNNIQRTSYWSSTDDGGVDVLYLNFADGELNNTFPSESNALAAWAVRPGDVAAVTEPGSLLLLALGALGLDWARRRKS